MLCVARSLCFSLAECVLVKFCVNMRFMSVLFCVSTWLDCFHLPCAYVFVMFGVSTWLVIRFLVPCAFLSIVFTLPILLSDYTVDPFAPPVLVTCLPPYLLLQSSARLLLYVLYVSLSLVFIESSLHPFTLTVHLKKYI